jgi:hypothetical protein
MFNYFACITFLITAVEPSASVRTSNSMQKFDSPKMPPFCSNFVRESSFAFESLFVARSLNLFVALFEKPLLKDECYA